MAECEVVDCGAEIKKDGHTLCYEHWTAKRDGLLSKCAVCGRLKEGDKPLCYPCFKNKSSGAKAAPSGGETLSATELGEIFGISAQRLNLTLAELGWVNREHKGWTATPQGQRAGGLDREARQTGIPYVVWSPEVQHHRALIAAIRGEAEVAAPSVQAAAPETSVTGASTNFRDRYDAQYRTQDGHRVRSRAELMIDDWLYRQNIVHAYERLLPVEEQVVCDFWLPQSRVYIEYWGMEQDAAYAARKKAKQAVYEKHGMNLVELGDEELKSIDDHLPRLLRKFGVKID